MLRTYARKLAPVLRIMNYLLLRRSATPIFAAEDGLMAPCDKAVLTVLQKLDSISEKDKRCRTAVSLVECFDGWFTDNANWGILSSMFRHISLQITMEVPVEFAKRLPFMFRRRGVIPDEKDSTASVRFDVHFVAQAHDLLERDSSNDPE